MFLLPWHLSDRLVDGLNVTLPSDTIEVTGEPGSTGQPWADLVSLYAPLRDAVVNTDGVPVVLSGDCVASLAVIAAIQQRGTAATLVWFDAHGDFHTEATTTSGYLGGLPLAKAVGRGDLSLPSALGMAALPEDWVILSDGRDLDPPERAALAGSRVRRVPVDDLDPSVLPDGPVIIHVDLDVIDPAQLRGLRFPAPGGPPVAAVAEAVHAVATTHPVAALDIAATWLPDAADPAQANAALNAVLAAAGLS
ncbi:MAG TPA: arginase family protein [Mycobacterium sp.]|nr:arginase family protein [Mycobacterium sp.]